MSPDTEWSRFRTNAAGRYRVTPLIGVMHRDGGREPAQVSLGQWCLTHWSVRMSCVIPCSRCWKNIQIRIPPWALSYWGDVVDDLQHCGCFRWWIQSGDTSSPLSRLSIYHLFRLGTASPNLTFFVPKSLSLGHTFVFLYQHINTHSVRSRRCLGFYHVSTAGGLLQKVIITKERGVELPSDCGMREPWRKF